MVYVFRGTVAFALIAVFAVCASSLSLLPASVYSDACICDTDQVNFEAFNNGAAAEQFAFSITGDYPWGIIAPASANIDAGEAATVYSFLTPTCFSSVGVYHFTVKGQSATQSATSSITLNIQPCLSLEDLEPVKEMCFGEKKAYQLLLKNDSRTADKNYTLFVTGNGAAGVTVPTVVFVPSEGASIATLEIDSTRLAVGEYSATVRAVSIYALTGQPTEDEDTITIHFSIEDCQSLSLAFPTLEDERVDKCTETAVSFPMLVKNNGALTDSVALTASSTKVSFSQKTLSLAPGAQTTVTVALDKNTGNSTFTITASSGLGARTDSVLTVDSQPCYGVEINPEIPARVCSDRVSKHAVRIRNPGDAAYFNVSLSNVSFMYLNETRVHLDSGEEKVVYLVITPGIKDGNYTPNFYAESPYADGEASQLFELVRCYDVEILAEKDFVCQCQDKVFPIAVVNTGYFDDSFELGLSSGPEWLEFSNVSATEINGKSLKTLLPHVFTCDAEPGEYAAVFNALSLSRNSSDKVCLNITVHSKAECYTALLTAPSGEYVECASSVIPVTVKNMGLLRNTFALSVEGPKWASLRPEFVTLEPQEATTVYLVVSPPLNEAGTTHDVTVKALSTGVSSSVTVQVIVVGAGEKPSVETKPFTANVSYADGALVIESLPGALVHVESPSGENYTMLADASGVATLSAETEGKWLITVLKEGFAPVVMEYSLGGTGTPQTGWFTGVLSGKALIYLGILALFVASGAFVYQQFLAKRK
ncbi:MAG: hypothetical protein WC607_00910 [Candidatus Micrarchaeia archaeon]